MGVLAYRSQTTVNTRDEHYGLFIINRNKLVGDGRYGAFLTVFLYDCIKYYRVFNHVRCYPIHQNTALRSHGKYEERYVAMLLLP